MNSVAPILVLREVSYSTPDGRQLGSHINCELTRGEMLVITGPNGSGKSTLLEIILNQRPRFSGSVQLKVPHSAIRYLPQLQESQTHMPFSLRDVLQVSTRAPVSDEDIVQTGLLNRSQLALGWNHASGGERRRTLLTRTLLAKPELIVLDEPFNHLDDDSRIAITAALRQFVLTENKCVILSTHNLSQTIQSLRDATIKHISL